MVLRACGEILTDNHVVEAATSITVTDIGNKTSHPASVVGYDRALDIAVLQLAAASGLKATNIANDTKVALGHGVIAIGNAAGVGECR